MMTQDSLRFYKSHAVYPNFGGVVLDREEGKKIAQCLGDGKAAILQNHMLRLFLQRNFLSIHIGHGDRISGGRAGGRQLRGESDVGPPRRGLECVRT